MKYLFVFLLIGLVSCGDASGDAADASTDAAKGAANDLIEKGADAAKRAVE